jgi:hypothetical protein
LAMLRGVELHLKKSLVRTLPHGPFPPLGPR